MTRQEQLSGWRRDADGDLGTMVCRVMRAAENPVCSQGQEVTVEDIEKALEELSSRSIFSSQRHIEAAGPSRGAADILGPLFRKMTSTEGKWFTRAILKSYLPVIIPEKVTMDAYHFLLPSLWAVQSDLRRCLEVLEGPVFKIFPPKPEKADQRGLLEAAAKLVRPQVGVRVGRVEFVKARVSEIVDRKQLKLGARGVRGMLISHDFCRAVRMRRRWRMGRECQWRGSTMGVRMHY